MDIKLLHGDCLVESDNIESGSVDLILTDLPYGTVAHIGDSDTIEHGMKGKTKWDEAIEPKKIYEIANRILRKNGKLVLFSQEPYTSRLTNEAIPNAPFNYRMIWAKDHFANSLIAKKAPVSYYEDVLVFSKKNPVHDCEFMHPLRPYSKLVMAYIRLSKKEIIDRIGQRADHTFRTDSTQFSLCTEATYNGRAGHRRCLRTVEPLIGDNDGDGGPGTTRLHEHRDRRGPHRVGPKTARGGENALAKCTKNSPKVCAIVNENAPIYP